MRDDETDINTIELSSTSGSTHQAQNNFVGNEHTENVHDDLLPSYKRNTDKNNASVPDAAPPEERWPRWMVFQQPKELIYFLAVVATAIPIILLLRYAPTLSTQLGSYACLPNGQFMLPGTASIWSASLFFTISIVAQGRDGTLGYTHVKIIDIIWDVAMGRGGQLLLIYVAYRVFSQSLAYVMETHPVSYQTYHAVSFESTSLRSMWQYVRNLSWDRSKQTWRGWGIFVAMTLASLYVVSMPTLFSAMTGYAAVFSPSLEMPPAGFEGGWNCEAAGGCTIFPCGGGGAGDESGGDGLTPGWGVVIDSTRVGYVSPWAISVPDADGSNGKNDAYYLKQCK